MKKTRYPPEPFIFFGGLAFGFGLALSGMTKPEIVLSFLQLKDLGLALVIGGALCISLLTIYLAPIIRKEPKTGGRYEKRERPLNRSTIIGAVIFGIGWGLSGICPGSAIASLGIGNIPIIIGIAGMFIGAYIHGMLANMKK